MDQSTMLDLTIDGIDPSFLEHCVSITNNVVKTQSDTKSPVLPTAPEFDKPKDQADQTRLTKNYPDAYTDTTAWSVGNPSSSRRALLGPSPPVIRTLNPSAASCAPSTIIPSCPPGTRSSQTSGNTSRKSGRFSRLSWDLASPTLEQKRQSARWL